MKNKKLLKTLLVGAIASFSVMLNVHAANTVSMSCDKTEIQVGESTTCTVSATSTLDKLTKASITLTTSQYLSISNVKANTAAGWQADSANTTSTNYVFTAINSDTGITAGTTQVFSFTVTLLDSAKNLSAGDSCGQICIGGAAYNDMALSSIDQTAAGTCFSPIIYVKSPHTI